ncbi:hypothetical protein IJ596_00180 [bacterium]|nr:hypothetical protein [bacterium]
MRINALSYANYSYVNLKPQNQNRTTQIQFKANNTIEDALRANTKHDPQILTNLIRSQNKEEYNQTLMQYAKSIYGEDFELPSQTDFDEMIKNDDRLGEFGKKKWRSSYEKDPLKTWLYYNMKDAEGLSVVTISERYPGYIHGRPEIVQELLNVRDKNGIRLFSFDDAVKLSKEAAYVIAGIDRMLRLKDENGGFRFRDRHSYVDAAEYFKEFPTLAINLAYEKDELGNYKYGGGAELARAIEKIIYPSLRSPQIQHSKTPKPISEIKSPDGESFDLSDDKTKEKILSLYEKYPKEFETFVQLSRRESNRESRFDMHDINEDVLKYLKYAPKTFMTLTNTRIEINYMKHLHLPSITYIMSQCCIDSKTGDIHEIDQQDLKSIMMLLKSLDGRDHFETKEIEDIVRAKDIYKKYPVETVEIMRKYRSDKNKNKDKIFVPTEADIKLYINNTDEFNRLHLIHNEFTTNY